MKRLFAIVLTIALAVSAMVMPVSAADAPVGISTAEGKPGETVSLVVSLNGLENVTGIAAVYTIPEELEYVDSEWLLENEIETVESGKAALGLEEAQDISGDVLKLTFKIKDTAKAKTTCQVSVTVEVKGNDFNAVLCKETVSGSVSVKSAVLENPFVDVPESEFYYEAVLWAVDEEITAGYGSATKFAPDVECTRAQIVTFLWRAAGQPEPASSYNPFTDVPNGDWYSEAVLWAVEKGITSGYGSATIFNPDGICTRGQVATFLHRYFHEPEYISGNPFTDVAQGDFFYDAVLWAVEKGITNGYGSATIYNPNGNCTRGQIVTFLHRAVG